MRVLGTIFGIALIVLAGVGLVQILQNPDGGFWGDVLAGQFCEESEYISQSEEPSASGNLTNDYFCTNSDHITQANITDSVLLSAVGGASVVGILGFLLLIISRKSTRKKNIATFQNMEGTEWQTVHVNGTQLTDEQLAHLQQSSEQLGEMLQGILTTVTKFSTRNDLTSRLEQLKEAHDKGLISAEEYEKVRKAILDAMDDNLL